MFFLKQQQRIPGYGLKFRASRSMEQLYHLTASIGIMKITVNYQSGHRQSFIVPKNMLALDFRKRAEEIGGKIDNIEFSLSKNHVGFYNSEIKESILHPD